MQELQRLQEEQTGKKSREKLEWMYATPASGSSQNQNDLEDYLLGKKRVDKILIGTENEKVKSFLVVYRFHPSYHSLQIGAAHKNFIAVQNANTARDVAAKVREDPLLAIKQQEAAAYEALMSNPLRLRELQERNGIKPTKKEKKEKRREKRERKEQRRRDRGQRHSSPMSPSDDERDYDRRRASRSQRSLSPHDCRSRSPIVSRSPINSRRYNDRDDRRHPSYSPRQDGRRSHSPDPRYRPRQGDYGMGTGRGRTRDERSPRWPRSDESDRDSRERRGRSRDHSPDLRIRDNSGGGLRKRYRSRSPVHDHKRARPSPPPKPSTAASGSEDRAARLAAMTNNAAEMSTERKDRLNALLEKEKAELEAEERARAKSKGMGGFLSGEQKKVFGGHGGLEERLRRGRAGLVAQVD